MKTRSPELALGHQKTVDVPQNCELYLALDESKDSQKAPGEPFQLFPYFPHIKPSSPPRQMHNLLILVLLHLFPSRPKQKCTFFLCWEGNACSPEPSHPPVFFTDTEKKSILIFFKTTCFMDPGKRKQTVLVIK